MEYPAPSSKGGYMKAIPAGNGTIGIGVYGNIKTERVLLTHENLWWQSKTPKLPDVSCCLPEVRKALLDNEFFKADSIYVNAFKQADYKPHIGKPLPLGDLRIINCNNGGFSNYTRKLDMETGEITVEFTQNDTLYERKHFVSRAHDCVFSEIKSHGNEYINIGLALGLHDTRDVPARIKNLSEYLPKNLKTDGSKNIIKYSATNDDNKDFGAVLKIISCDGNLSYENDVLLIKNATKVLFAISVFVNNDSGTGLEVSQNNIEKVANDYKILLKEHLSVYSPLFTKTSFKITDEEDDLNYISNERLLLDAYKGKASKILIEKLWNFGKYLYISSTSNKSNPCHLYGLWCGDYDGFWAFHVADENVQMINWHALSGNLTQLLLPLFDYFDRLIPDFRENAKKIFNCRGMYVSLVTSPDSGILKTIAPHVIHWTGAGGWIAQHYFDYYLYTLDYSFLVERAIPFMEEVALFYEDFLSVDDNGDYIFMPSVSPENNPGNFWDGKGMGGVMRTTMNATMDFAILKELLNNLIEGYKITNQKPNKIQEYSNILEKIQSYQINARGEIREWMHDAFSDNNHHRHQTHLYPLFPGTEINFTSKDKYYEAIKNSAINRFNEGINEQTGWSYIHMAHTFARLEDRNHPIQCIDRMVQSSVLNNFLSMHNDWRDMGTTVNMDNTPVQIDANIGLVSLIYEMLIFSVPGNINILPALPDNWNEGSLENVLLKGRIEASVYWSKKSETIRVKLLSLNKDQEVNLYFPCEVIRDDLTDTKASKIHKVKLLKNEICNLTFKYDEKSL